MPNETDRRELLALLAETWDSSPGYSLMELLDVVGSASGKKEPDRDVKYRLLTLLAIWRPIHAPNRFSTSSTLTPSTPTITAAGLP